MFIDKLSKASLQRRWEKKYVYEKRTRLFTYNADDLWQDIFMFTLHMFCIHFPEIMIS